MGSQGDLAALPGGGAGLAQQADDDTEDWGLWSRPCVCKNTRSRLIGGQPAVDTRRAMKCWRWSVVLEGRQGGSTPRGRARGRRMCQARGRRQWEGTSLRAAARGCCSPAPRQRPLGHRHHSSSLPRLTNPSSSLRLLLLVLFLLFLLLFFLLSPVAHRLITPPVALPPHPPPPLFLLLCVVTDRGRKRGLRPLHTIFLYLF